MSPRPLSPEAAAGPALLILTARRGRERGGPERPDAGWPLPLGGQRLNFQSVEGGWPQVGHREDIAILWEPRETSRASLTSHKPRTRCTHTPPTHTPPAGQERVGACGRFAALPSDLDVSPDWLDFSGGSVRTHPHSWQLRPWVRCQLLMGILDDPHFCEGARPSDARARSCLGCKLVFLSGAEGGWFEGILQGGTGLVGIKGHGQGPAQ